VQEEVGAGSEAETEVAQAERETTKRGTKSEAETGNNVDSRDPSVSPSVSDDSPSPNKRMLRPAYHAIREQSKLLKRENYVLKQKVNAQLFTTNLLLAERSRAQ
jgi:hypothetical protein